jgi:hypothetical protein
LVVSARGTRAGAEGDDFRSDRGWYVEPLAQAAIISDAPGKGWESSVKTVSSGKSLRLVGGLTAAGVTIAMTSACSSGGSTKPAAASSATGATSAASGASTPTTAAPTAAAPAAAGSLSADQLKGALLAAADVPGYTADPSSAASGLKTDQEKVSDGGAVCQKFMDANDALVSAYGTTAEAEGAWQDQANGVLVQISMMAFPSADKAKAVVADVKSSVAGCQQLSAGTGTEAGTMAITPLPDIQAGDSSTGFVASVQIGSVTFNEVVATVQVGSSSFSVTVGGPGLDKATAPAKVADLKGYATKQAAKLKAAQK